MARGVRGIFCMRPEPSPASTARESSKAARGPPSRMAADRRPTGFLPSARDRYVLDQETRPIASRRECNRARLRRADFAARAAPLAWDGQGIGPQTRQQGRSLNPNGPADDFSPRRPGTTTSLRGDHRRRPPAGHAAHDERVEPAPDRYLRLLARFSAIASRMRPDSAASSILSLSRMSIARRTFPSRLELNRRDGSFSAAPFANVSLTTSL